MVKKKKKKKKKKRAVTSGGLATKSYLKRIVMSSKFIEIDISIILIYLYIYIFIYIYIYIYNSNTRFLDSNNYKKYPLVPELVESSNLILLTHLQW